MTKYERITLDGGSQGILVLAELRQKIGVGHQQGLVLCATFCSWNGPDLIDIILQFRDLALDVLDGLGHGLVLGAIMLIWMEGLDLEI